jgi:hypothetical protein
MTRTRVLLVAALLALTGLTGFPGAAPVRAEVGDPTDSQVTVPGTGEFANLRVTVNQTRKLISQTVRVSWTGHKQTMGSINNNFLQIMQCWSDDPAGPDRTQCQFGAIPNDFANLANRHVVSDHVLDPAEGLAPGAENSWVPYWVPGGEKPDPLVKQGAAASAYLDSQLSNEAPQLRTRRNGDGEEFFQIQTLRQNAGLDCGKPVGATPNLTGKPCWLVIVPRGTTEVDGSAQSALESSPLSKTNWAKRIQIKLEFLPVQQACQFGAAERPVRGHEMAVEAISSWQSALCATDHGTIFSYTQFSDEIARSRLSSPDPGLAVLTDPLPAEAVVPEHPLVYAPIALSGLAVAYNMESQPWGGRPEDLSGKRFTDLKLTPRLMAKLLTQSYKEAVVGDQPYLKNNPIALTRDKEFLDLNPDYDHEDRTNRSAEPILQFGNADVTALLWAWVLGDADARAFLSGQPDPNGMVVNPNNKGLTEPLPIVPRQDPGCGKIPFVGGEATVCTPDTHPAATDMHEAGRAAGLGFLFSRTPNNVVPGSDPPIVQYSRPGRQSAGSRSVMAVVDTATAARYGLEVAKLKNANGEFVAPTGDGLRAGFAAMKPSSIPGVLKPDPRTTKAGAYPLTTVSYAVTAPSELDKDAGKAYAEFLNYAAVSGQEPGVDLGKLPEGYEPLPLSLRVQTVLAANTVATLAGVPVTVAAPAPENPGNSGGSSAPVDGGSVPAGAASPAPAPAPAPSTSAAPGTGTAVVTKAEPTPAIAAPKVWTLIVGLLICGAVAGALAPLAHYLGGRRRAGPDGGG